MQIEEFRPDTFNAIAKGYIDKGLMHQTSKAFFSHFTINSNNFSERNTLVYMAFKLIPENTNKKKQTRKQAEQPTLLFLKNGVYLVYESL